jgi:hypothetical protein
MPVNPRKQQAGQAPATGGQDKASPSRGGQKPGSEPAALAAKTDPAKEAAREDEERPPVGKSNPERNGRQPTAGAEADSAAHQEADQQGAPEPQVADEQRPTEDSLKPRRRPRARLVAVTINGEVKEYREDLVRACVILAALDSNDRVSSGVGWGYHFRHLRGLPPGADHVLQRLVRDGLALTTKDHGLLYARATPLTLDVARGAPEWLRDDAWAAFREWAVPQRAKNVAKLAARKAKQAAKFTDGTAVEELLALLEQIGEQADRPGFEQDRDVQAEVGRLVIRCHALFGRTRRGQGSWQDWAGLNMPITIREMYRYWNLVTKGRP